MENRHGFVNMLPHAKFLHPVMGWSGFHGPAIFQTRSNPNYSQNFCALIASGKYVYKHHVKMFFPEIRKGMLLVDKLKYSIDKSESDTVELSTKVIVDGKFEEYVSIDDFIAEFTVEISLSFGERGSITAPVEIYCDFIDIYIHNQKISLTVHDNNLLFIPYLMSYRADFPPEVARLDNKSLNLELNSSLSYGFIMNEDAKEKFEEKGFSPVSIDTVLLDTKKLKEALVHDIGNSGSFSINRNPVDIFTSMDTVSKKFAMLLPQAIFPDRMTLSGLPIFDSDIVMPCCGYWKLGLCSPYLPRYGVKVPAQCSPFPCDSPPCEDQPQYEVRNRCIDGYMLLAEKDFEYLDREAGLLMTNIKNDEEYEIEGE
jgi:hypothetical protein